MFGFLCVGGGILRLCGRAIGWVSTGTCCVFSRRCARTAHTCLLTLFDGMHGTPMHACSTYTVWACAFVCTTLSALQHLASVCNTCVCYIWVCQELQNYRVCAAFLSVNACALHNSACCLSVLACPMHRQRKPGPAAAAHCSACAIMANRQCHSTYTARCFVGQQRCARCHYGASIKVL